MISSQRCASATDRVTQFAQHPVGELGEPVLRPLTRLGRGGRRAATETTAKESSSSWCSKASPEHTSDQSR